MVAIVTCAASGIGFASRIQKTKTFTGLITLAVMFAAGTTLFAHAEETPAMKTQTTDQQKYIGMWVTRDGRIRHELLPNGRYDEARGPKKSAYQGRYWLEGDHIEYVDDTGFTADGDFRDGMLYRAGMIFYRVEKK